MSGNQQDPDIMCEVFILAPTDLVDDHEIRDGGRVIRRLTPRHSATLDQRSSNVGGGGHPSWGRPSGAGSTT